MLMEIKLRLQVGKIKNNILNRINILVICRVGYRKVFLVFCLVDKYRGWIRGKVLYYVVMRDWIF